jgi:acyl-CoA thioester hydrolase
VSFHWESPVFFDELDRNGTLHNSRFALHVEFHAAFTAPGVLPVEITADGIGATSARYGFRCGRYASGYRVIVKVGQDGRPAPWSDWYRMAFEGLS